MLHSDYQNFFWVVFVRSFAAFLYLNRILFINLIQGVADARDGYVSDFDEDLVLNIHEILFRLLFYIY